MKKTAVIKLVLFLLFINILSFTVSAATSPYITIIDNDGYTNDMTPLIQLADSSGGYSVPYEVAFSCDDINFVDWFLWNTTIDDFDITDISSGCNNSDGNRTIYVKGRDINHTESLTTKHDTTFLDRVLPIITDEKYYPDIIFNVTDAQFNATVNEDNVLEEVIFSINGDNYTVTTFNVDEYYYHADSSLFTDGATVYWRYYARDKAGNIAVSSLNSFAVTARTQCTLSPAEPDGNEGWYITLPFISCSADSGRTPYCRFGSTEFECSSSFNFNVSSLTGGIEDLIYWSVDGVTEPEQEMIIKVDTYPPVIKDIFPEQDSTVIANSTMISAYIDEVYQGNSGVNLSSVELYLDDVLVDSGVILVGPIDAFVSYSAENLTDGLHDVMLKAKDTADNQESEKTWSFNVNTTDYLQMNVNSPENIFYDTRRILVNVNLNNEAYLEKSINGKKFSRLCKWCDYYDRTYSFVEGWNNITIRATKGLNQIAEIREFYVDTREPRIRSIEPRDGDYVNGTFFRITYIEDDLEQIVLHYREAGVGSYIEDVWTHCMSGSNVECSKEINLSSFNEKNVEFYFTVNDKVHSVDSDVNTITVDTEKPVITSFISPENGAWYGNRRIALTFDVSEYVSLEASVNGGRPRILSRYCDSYNKELSFTEGHNTLEIKATDKAGNSAKEFREFYVDTRKPRIMSIEPKDKSYVNGTEFKVKYSEDNMEDVILHYKEKSAGTYIDDSLYDYCVSGTNVECSKVIDLSSFNGNEVEFYFTVKDFASSVDSKKYTITVDKDKPIITVVSPIDEQSYSENIIYITVQLNEKVSLLEKSENGEPYRFMCRNCDYSNKRDYFKEGSYTLDFRATDYAGNVQEEEISFSVGD